MEEQQLTVVGLTRRHVRSGSSSSPPPAAAATDSNRNESEGGDFISEFRRKKGKKAKALKWGSSNSGMNNGNGEAEGSNGDCDDTVLSSLTTASFSNLISGKRVRTLGKVAEDCDAVDPPVPRKLRSAINKRAGRTVSSSPRHVKKRRQLSAISAQIFLMDRETRFNESLARNSFTKEEEVLADTLLSLSQIPLYEPTDDMAVAEDNSNINVASTSCSEGAIKEDDKITVLPSAASEVTTQPACADQPVERTGSVPQINPSLGAPHNSINPHLPKDGQIQELSLGIVTNLPSPSKDSSNNSAQKQLKVQFDNSLTNPAKTADPQWLVNHNKPDFVVYDGKKAENNSAQVTSSEIAPSVQTPLNCTSHGPSSSMLGARINPATETAKASATGNSDKLSLFKSSDLTKTWKKSITHVYVSHLIQTHLNKDKASQNRVKPDERSHSRISRSPNVSTLNKNNVQDKRFYATNCDPTLPVQPSSGICDMVAGQQKMVSSSFLNLPTSASSSGAQHVQYLHPQITHRGAMPYPYPHIPCSRGNLASPMALQQQMQQYMCNPGYATHPSLPASPAVMKLQQFAPTLQQQQQQQMWQFHFSQYQPRPDGTAPPAWQNSRLQDMSSLRPMLVLPPPAMPPQMELLCAPYQGSGRRPPSQVRLI